MEIAIFVLSFCSFGSLIGNLCLWMWGRESASQIKRIEDIVGAPRLGWTLDMKVRALHDISEERGNLLKAYQEEKIERLLWDLYLDIAEILEEHGRYYCIIPNVAHLNKEQVITKRNLSVRHFNGEFHLMASFGGEEMSVDTIIHYQEYKNANKD